MPLDANNDLGMRMYLGLRRDPTTQRLNVFIELKTHQGERITTVQEGVFPIGDDMLYDRLQEHANNCLRRLANEWPKLEKASRR